MSVELITFGCRLNTYESEVMRAHAQAAGLENAVIFNTCAVTAEAEKTARSAIRKLKRERPDARIIVTGCAAQIDPQSFARMDEVDNVLGNQEKMLENSWASLTTDHRPLITVNDIMSVKETASHLVTAFDGRARAFIQVQNGCDHRCTFCIIPYGRGNSRSVPMGEIVAQVRALVEAGYNEVVFTGVDVSAYGADLPGAPTLGQMIRRVLALVPELPRLRLSSIDAVEVDTDLYRLIAEEPRLMPHLHISIQAGDDMVLKRMKRRHLRADILAFCERVRSLRPNMAFGADMIAGFPTETDAMFENTLRLIDEVGLRYVHVFPYSARKGTPAARMPQVPLGVRKERAKRLREAAARQHRLQLQNYVGREVTMVVEQDGKTGHSESFVKVKLPHAEMPGSMVCTRVIAAHSDYVEGG